MSKKNTTRAALVATLAAAATAVAGGAAAEEAPRAPERADAAATVATPPAAPTPAVERQAGLVIEGVGAAGGLTASVTVYENSRYGNSVQVVLDEDRIGHEERVAAYVVDGVLSASVEIDGRTATLSGTVAPSGRPVKLTEPVQDAGEQVVSRGTNTPLAGDVTLTYDGVVVPLDLAPAFAYDLEVQKVARYGR